MVRRSTACNRTDDEKRLLSGPHGVRQRRIRQIVREITLARKKTNVSAAFLRGVIADRAAQNRKPLLERVEQFALRNGSVDLDRYFAVDLRQRPQMRR